MIRSTTPLKRLSVLTIREDMSDLHLPTITDNAQDVVGLHGRIRLQKNEKSTTSQWMDKQRNTLLAYEYLCHIGEAKEWIENCLQETIQPIIELEDSMRDGVVLAKLASWFAPGVVRKIVENSKHKFLQSENINSFFKALHAIRLPQTFWFELTDLYDKKNIPKVIFCIHALSHMLARKNMAPNIKNLVGAFEFTSEELFATQKVLDSYGVAMPNFTTIGFSLQKELDEYDLNPNFQFQRIDLTPFAYDEQALTIKTPELIMEESDSEEEGLFECYSPMIHQHQIKTAYWMEPNNLKKLVQCQALARKWLTRREFNKIQQVHRSTFFQSHVSHLQARVRGVLCRRELEDKRITFTSHDELWINRLQDTCRGFLAQLKHQRLLDSIDHSVRTAEFTTNTLFHNVHQELVFTDKPSIGTVKNFIHLLDDSDLDYNAEMKLEVIRHEVIQCIRDNHALDAHVNSIDTKIALLVQNAITIDQIIKQAGWLRKKEQHRQFTRLAAEAESASHGVDPFSMRIINQKNQTVLDLYQRLVYLLQTEPKYLAELVSLTGAQDAGGDDHRRIESTILALFGYATNPREEYLLINLCRVCIAQEIKHMQSPQEFMRGNYAFMKLVVQTNRGAKEREFFQTAMAPLIKQIVNDEFLSLETNPIDIYQSVICDEESRTGLPSCRKPTVNAQEALADDEVRHIFVSNLRTLRQVTDQFLCTIISATDELPYGIRAVARELLLVLKQKFTNEPPQNIAKILAYFIYYRYLNPCIVAPEQYDVIDGKIDQHQRKNLAEVSRMLQQVSSSKMFDTNDSFLAPLNDYVLDAGLRFAEWLIKVANVDDPKTHFGVDTLDDHTQTHKPTIYISPDEIYHLHYVIEQHLQDLAPNQQGTLYEIITDLGSSPFKPGARLPDTTWCLRLCNRYEDIHQDSSTQLQQLIVDTKRLVVYVIQIQTGQHLQDIFEQPPSDQHEAHWSKVKEMEFITADNTDGRESLAKKRRRVKLGSTQLDLNEVNFFQLKAITSRLVAHLANCVDDVSTEDHFQGILNWIANDITGKHTRRQRRRQEMTKLSRTLEHLRHKQTYLLDQRQRYEDYLKLSMDSMAKKRGKKNRFVLPFTRQYFHMRHLTRQGLVPTFGSFEYTARQLYDRGVIVDLDGVTKKHYDRIAMTLSMDEAGIIHLEGRYAHWTTVCMDLHYEQLLQAQFEGVQIITFLDGLVKVNVNLLIYLINKKFYSA